MLSDEEKVGNTSRMANTSRNPIYDSNESVTQGAGLVSFLDRIWLKSTNFCGCCTSTLADLNRSGKCGLITLHSSLLKRLQTGTITSGAISSQNDNGTSKFSFIPHTTTLEKATTTLIRGGVVSYYCRVHSTTDTPFHFLYFGPYLLGPSAKAAVPCRPSLRIAHASPSQAQSFFIFFIFFI